jgi:hypothetical protein
MFAMLAELVQSKKSNIKRERIVLMDLDGTLFPWNEGADFTAPGYFANLQAFSTMKQLVDILRNDPRYKFRFCTAYIHDTAKEEKLISLRAIWPDLRDDEVIFVPYGMSKFDFVPECKDFNNIICIIDDHSPNLFDAEKHGVKGIKAINGVNGRNGSWKGEKLYVFDSAIKNAKIVKAIML